VNVPHPSGPAEILRRIAFTFGVLAALSVVCGTRANLAETLARPPRHMNQKLAADELAVIAIPFQ